jgi:hypothetical protein
MSSGWDMASCAGAAGIVQFAFRHLKAWTHRQARHARSCPDMIVYITKHSEYIRKKGITNTLQHDSHRDLFCPTIDPVSRVRIAKYLPVHDTTPSFTGRDGKRRSRAVEHRSIVLRNWTSPSSTAPLYVATMVQSTYLAMQPGILRPSTKCAYHQIHDV